MKKKFSDPVVMFIAVMIGVYYIVLGSVLVTIGVSKAVEVVSLIVPALITGSLTTIFVQILIKRLKKKKAAETGSEEENTDEK